MKTRVIRRTQNKRQFEKEKLVDVPTVLSTTERDKNIQVHQSFAEDLASLRHWRGPYVPALGAVTGTFV